MPDLRLTATVTVNGQNYTVTAATPEVFAEWLAGLAVIFARRPGPGAYFECRGITVYDAERA